MMHMLFRVAERVLVCFLKRLFKMAGSGARAVGIVQPEIQKFVPHFKLFIKTKDGSHNGVNSEHAFKSLQVHMHTCVCVCVCVCLNVFVFVCVCACRRQSGRSFSVAPTGALWRASFRVAVAPRQLRRPSARNTTAS